MLRSTSAVAAASLRRVDTVLVLIPAKNGRAYLVLAYRFTGTAYVRGFAQTRPWLGLAPGALR